MAKRKKKGVSPLIQEAKRVLRDIRANMAEGETFEDLDPQAHEAVGIVLGIMRGTIRGRHLATRLTAALAILHQYRGKPVGKHEVDVGDNLVDLIQKSMELEEKTKGSLPKPKKRDPALLEEPPIDVEVVADEQDSHSSAS